MGMLLVTGCSRCSAQTPQPFPEAGAAASRRAAAPRAGRAAAAPPRQCRRPAQPAPGPNDVPTEATLGVPIYPGAEFVGSFDAGRGQRYYLFGTNTGVPRDRQLLQDRPQAEG